MTLPYGLRLLSICLAFFFFVQFAAGVAVSLLTPASVAVAGRLRPAAAARLLLALRFLPAGLAVAAVAALCIPSYLGFEPESPTEAVDAPFLGAALLGLIICVASLRHVVSAIRSLAASARSRPVPGPDPSVPGLFRRLPGFAARQHRSDELLCVVEAPAPLCALSGILRPRLLISRGVLEALSAEQLGVVLDHECAHLDSRDNLKRLLLWLAPRHPRSTVLDREWSRFAEFAADDRAVAGDAGRSLTLASALVRVARLGSGPRIALAANLIPDGRRLAERVERLLAGPLPVQDSRAGRAGWWIGAATATAAIALITQPASLRGVHDVIERLMH